MNRCQARIAIQCYETALDDAQFILTNCPKGVQSPRHEKALFRCARALYELERYEQCLLELQKLCKFYPQNERAAGELARCQQRVLEATSGCYNFEAWIAHATERVKNKQSPLIDAATFCSPVEVRKSDTHGYGLFTKKVVEAGDLLLCEKAFLCAFSFADAHSSASQNQELKRRLSIISPADSPDNPTLDQNGFSQSDPINMELLAGTLHKVHRNLDFYHEAFASLYPGSIDNIRAFPSVLNSTLHYSIVEKNKFFQGSAHTLFTLHGGDRRQNGDPELPIEDILQRLLSLQANESSARPIEDILESLMSSSSKHPYLPASTMGMWLLACRANHACLPNVSRSFIGDMLILRASRPLPAGSEIFVSYTSGTEPYNTRRANLRRYGFQCKCAMCEMDEMVSEGAHAQREGLLNGLITDMMSPKATTGEEIDLWIKKIGMTYACDSRDSMAPRLDMSTSLFWAVKGGVDSGIPQMVFQYGMLLLHVMGFDFEVKDDDEIEISQWGIQTAFVVETLWYLREATGKGGPGWNTIDAALRKTYLMEVGEDSSFERFYGDPE